MGIENEKEMRRIGAMNGIGEWSFCLGLLSVGIVIVWDWFRCGIPFCLGGFFWASSSLAASTYSIVSFQG